MTRIEAVTEVETMSYWSARDDLRPLVLDHATEMNAASFKLDEDEILRFETERSLDLSVAFIHSIPVGYLVWLIGKHPALERARVARMGPWFVRRALRNGQAATLLFDHSLESLRSKGVDYAVPTINYRGSLEGFNDSAWLRRRGAVPLCCSWLLDLLPERH